jgi:hypothetical protein
VSVNNFFVEEGVFVFFKPNKLSMLIFYLNNTDHLSVICIFPTSTTKTIF